MNKVIGFIKIHKPFLIFLSIMVLFIFIFDICFYNSFTGSHYNVIFSDGEGYYAYLPSIFIHHNVFLERIPNFPYETISLNILPNGQLFNKYPIGVAILEFPFFIITHILFKGDGYSIPYQIAMSISCFFYWTIGIFITYLIIKSKFDTKIAIITSFFFILSTNFLQLATIFASMGHLYSFSMIALFVFLILKENNFKNKKLYSFILGILSSIIFLIKSINILVLLIYILYKVSDFKSFKIRLKEILSLERLPFNIIGFLIPLSLQMAYWYKISGKLFLNTYYNEYFSFLFQPKIFSILFGSTKGLFFYIPILLIIFFGFKEFKKQYKDIFLGTIIFLILTTYLIASWWIGWAQGDSFSSRMHADYYSILMLIFACSLSLIFKNKIYKKIFYIFATVCFIYTNFLFSMYIVHALPQESGLNSLKDIFSFRYVKSRFFARVEKIENKNYILYDARYNSIPYLEYPKGKYRVLIQGKNLAHGIYYVKTKPYSSENIVLDNAYDNEIGLNFDINKKVEDMWFIPNIIQNKNVRLDKIYIEKEPFEYFEKSGTIETILPAFGEYIVNVKTNNPHKTNIDVFLDDKITKQYFKKINGDEITFKIKIKKCDTNLAIVVDNPVAEISIKELDSLKLLIKFDKFNKIYKNSNPYNWQDNAILDYIEKNQ